MLNGNKLVEIGNINNSILAGTDKKILTYKPVGDPSLFIDDNKLKNMKLSINRNENIPLSYLNDVLNVAKFKLPSGTAKIYIEFTQMFSTDEYSLVEYILKKHKILV